MKLSQTEEFKLIEIRAKERLYALLSGNHLSKIYGEGYDFGELREYQIGDDIRKINWTITAKMQKPYIKELYSNRELSIVIAPIISPSLHFGEEGSRDIRVKQKIITEITALLGYATHHHQDLFTGIYFFNNKSYLTPPTKEIYNIKKFTEDIYTKEVLNSSLDYNQIATEIFTKVINRSIIFIIGDFLDKIELSTLSQKHEVIVIIVRDRGEEILKPLGEAIIQNPSTKTESRDRPFSYSNYRKKLKEQDEELYQHLNKFSIRYIKIYKDDNIVEKLIRGI